jgi:hypothetical protein
MGAIIAFGVSLTALVLFFVLKLVERTRNIPIYADVRHKGDGMVMAVIAHVRHRKVRIEQELSTRKVVQKTTHYTATAVARIARHVEGKAHEITRKMSPRNGAEGRATQSSFLREVSTHKKSLDTDRVKRETSLTRPGDNANGLVEDTIDEN